MFAVYLLCALGVASAAPHYQHHRHFPQHSSLEESDYFRSYFRDDDLLDTMKMWRELSDELVKLEDALNDFAKHYPTMGSTEERVDGSNYKITIPLPGFEEKDIVVKARAGLLMVQATHKNGNSNIMNSYLNMRGLPSNINVSGSWNFEEGVLTILFPIVNSESTTEVVELSTSPRPVDREEMEPVDRDDSGDADVGARGDLGNRTKHDSVEATTYSVNNSDDVEFVPLQYKVAAQ